LSFARSNPKKKPRREASPRDAVNVEQFGAWVVEDQDVHHDTMEDTMGFGRGLLLWLIGIPLPIIILLALFMHH
jgi:hypothetical protein